MDFFKLPEKTFKIRAQEALNTVLRNDESVYSHISTKEKEKIVHSLTDLYKEAQNMREKDFAIHFMMYRVKTFMQDLEVRLEGLTENKGIYSSSEYKETLFDMQNELKMYYLESKCIFLWTGFMDNTSVESLKSLGSANIHMYNKMKDNLSLLLQMKVPNDCERIPYPVKLKNFLNEWVVGQNDLKEKLALKIYHYLKHGDRSPLLMIGPSGCGKNYTMECLAKYPDIYNKIPVMPVDVSQITENGFKGNDIEDIFKRFRVLANSKNLSMDKGIIYLDEFDKIITPCTTSDGENVHAVIQQQMLSMIAGTECIGGVDTKNILFILGGAFGFLEEFQLKKHNKKSTIGFVTKDSADKGLLNKSTSSLRDDLIECGAQREMIGRIPQIVQMERLNREELREILLNHRFGALTTLQKLFEKDGVSLLVEDSVIDAIIEKSLSEDLGARSVINVVYDLFGDYLYKCIEGNYSAIIFHEEMLSSNAEPYYKKKH